MLTMPLKASPVLVLIIGFLWSQCLCFLLICAMIRTWRQKHSVRAEIMPAVMTGLGLVLFWSFYTCLSPGGGKTSVLFPLTGLPLSCCLIAALVLNGSAAWIFIRSARWETEHITPMSIRESFDTIPAGICFFHDNGKTGMINREMDRLCQIMTGESLQNGMLFWERLSSGKVMPDCEVIQAGTYPIIRTPDNRVFIFSGYEMWENRKMLCEIIASDITAEYGKAALLKERNEELKKINDRLRRYGETVTEVTREREILAAKTSIHDTINRVLLTTRRCIEDGSACTEEERERMFELWGENVLLLCRKEGRESGGDMLKELEEAASAIGIRLVFSGTMPESRERASVVLLAAGECLTNAARHADAKTLYIAVSPEKIEFTDDGHAPAGPIRVGGGISAIRRAAEKAGGCVTVCGEPRFCLTVTFGLTDGCI